MTKTVKLKKIVVPLDGIRGLMSDFGVSKCTVYAALKYASNSEMARMLRKSAVEKYGGVEMNVPVFV